MIKRNIILIGGGGHCKSCIDVIESCGHYDIKGVLDIPEKVSKKVLDYNIIGSDENLENYKEIANYFFITIGQIKSSSVRKRIFRNIKSLNYSIPTIISPLSRLSNYATLGEGTILMHGVKINACTQIGVNCIINTEANIEHDVIIGNHCHISTSSVVNGGSVIGDNVFIGSNATISSQVKITSNVVIGAGSVVTRNIEQPGIYAGSPATFIKYENE